MPSSPAVAPAAPEVEQPAAPAGPDEALRIDADTDFVETGVEGLPGSYLRLPSLAGAESGTVVQLAKREAAGVTSGDVLLVIAADGVNFEIVAPIHGTLTAWFAEQSGTVRTGDTLAFVGPSVSAPPAPTGEAPGPVSPQPPPGSATGGASAVSASQGEEPRVPAPASEDRVAGQGPSAAPAAEPTEQSSTSAPAASPAPEVTAPAEPATAEAPSGRETEEDGEEGDGFSEEEWRPTKGSGTAYVTPSIAQKVQEMQQRGYTAEAIVLTAVAEANERMPEVIRRSRGPVHDGGLFPGLPVVEKKEGPGRKVKVEKADTRLQYQISPEYLPALREVAKRHRLRRSTLVRLALGAYFDLPVRMGRTR
ncbi:biotin/lipoyl-containing protein [Streptomyces sp. NBRC 110465]|uniref:biotin/lipoyl-containing protein n=1 Tax=Streptomyces sp. NBRC 110465 TaxID=1897621 RepID=UPI000934BFDA|nr:biotin/lipoyl-containing protein [Streptomyces sp. NBRC 110465]